MSLLRTSFQVLAMVVLGCVLSVAQTPAVAKNFTKDSLSFDYSTGWVLQDDSTSDAQQLNLARANSDVSIGVFAHRGRISPEKFADAKKLFIDPYIAARVKQFVQMGLKPEQSPDSSEIGGVKADGVKISAVLGGDPGGAKIYWALIGQRVVVLTLFGPDREMKQFASAWDLVRNSLKVMESKPANTPSPKPSPE